MGKYQAYPEYKDSGVEWIEDLPSHWVIKRTKALFTLNRELVGKNSSDYQLLSLTLRGVIPRDISDGSGKIPAEFDTYQVVKTKDLIFCLFDIDETPRTIGIAFENGMITGAYNVYTCLDTCLPEYAYYYFMHIDSFKGLKPFYTGLRKVVRAETFSNIKVPVPSYEEQQKIANFLDHETAKIDTLIEKQQQLIQLLKEKRQAVISHAVTKGLNPNAPMKDSGVEWLGEVPEHWEVSQLKYKVKNDTSITYGIVQAGPHVEDGIPYIKTSDMSGDKLPLDGYSKTSHAIDSSYSRSKVYEGDIVIAIRATVGKCLLVPAEISGANLTQGTAKISPSDEISNEYLLSYLSSAPVQLYLNTIAKGATFKEITLDMLRRVPVLVPPIEEQSKVMIKVNTLMERFALLISNAERQMYLLSERRTALISAAVTGKIDVRNFSVQLT